MTDEKDTTVVQLGNIQPALRNGIASRAFMALSFTDEPFLTIEQIAEICGFAPSSLRYNNSMGSLFHGQLVEPVKDEMDRRRVLGYKLTKRARRSGYKKMPNAADAEIEELRERARVQTRTHKRKKVVSGGLSVVDGGSSEAESNE